jgi:FixJ family two-component response regulator
VAADAACPYSSFGQRDVIRRPALISIVDDDDSVREATKCLVSSLGFATVAFASAEEFLRSEQVHDTSCLITDVQMPGLNGLELQEQLVQGGHHIPVIFMTAFPEERLRTRAIEAGAYGFLEKPFDDESLIGCLHSALEGAGQRRR